MAFKAPGRYAGDHRILQFKENAEIVKACDVELSREDWYWVYKMAGNVIP